LDKKPVLVDARALNKKKAGVARYIISIVRELDKLGVDICLISNNEIFLDDDLSHIKKREFKAFKYLPGTLFILFVLKFFYLRGKPIFWGAGQTTPIFGFYSILTVHDLVAFKYPETMTFVNRFFNRISIFLSIRFSSVLSSVSNITKKEMQEYFEIEKSIHVVPNSVDRNVFSMNKNKIDSRFLLAVGTIEPRKNLIELLRAYELLVNFYDYGGYLYLIGDSGWKNDDLYAELERLQASDRVKFVGRVSDSELASYYSSCELFVFPSLYEGFGIPPFEALASGARVVCTKNSELPFVYSGEGAVFYSPQEDDLIEKIIEGLAIDKPLGVDFSTWKDSALELIRLMEGYEK